MNRLLLGLCLVVMAGCSSSVPTATRVDRLAGEDRARVKTLLTRPRSLETFLGNTTVKSWGPDGTRIQYFNRRGETWMIAPQFAAPLRGQWKVDKVGGENKVCYKFGAANWTCSAAWETVAQVDFVEIVRDDVLGLQSLTQLPKTLPFPDNLTIAQVRAYFGLPPAKLRNKVDWETIR